MVSVAGMEFNGSSASPRDANSYPGCVGPDSRRPLDETGEVRRNVITMTERRTFLRVDGFLSMERQNTIERFINGQLRDVETATAATDSVTDIVVHLRGQHCGDFDMVAFKDQLEDRFDLDITLAHDDLI